MWLPSRCTSHSPSAPYLRGRLTPACHQHQKPQPQPKPQTFPMITPPQCTVDWFTRTKPKKIQFFSFKTHKKGKKGFLMLENFSVTLFDQKSSALLFMVADEGNNTQTNRKQDGHCNSKAESAQGPIRWNLNLFHFKWRNFCDKLYPSGSYVQKQPQGNVLINVVSVFWADSSPKKPSKTHAGCKPKISL